MRTAFSSLTVLASIALVASVGGVSGVRPNPEPRAIDTPPPASVGAEPEVISTPAPAPTTFLDVLPRAGSKVGPRALVRVRATDPDSIAWVTAALVGQEPRRLTKRQGAYVGPVTGLSAGRNLVEIVVTDGRGDETARRVTLVR